MKKTEKSEGQVQATAPGAAEMKIDLSSFTLKNMSVEQKQHLPKPGVEFTPQAKRALEIYPQYEEQLKLQGEFNPELLKGYMQLMDELEPYQTWMEQKLEQIKETRLFYSSEVYQAILKLYQRAHAANEFDPAVGEAFSFLADYFRTSKRKGKGKGKDKEE